MELLNNYVCLLVEREDEREGMFCYSSWPFGLVGWLTRLHDNDAKQIFKIAYRKYSRTMRYAVIVGPWKFTIKI